MPRSPQAPCQKWCTAAPNRPRSLLQCPEQGPRGREHLRYERFAGKVAVVNGGTSGIGLATVQRLHVGGAAVAFCGRRPSGGEEITASVRSERHASCRLM